MTSQQESYGERIHRGELIGYLPSAREAEFRTDTGEVTLCDVELSSGDFNLNAHLRRPGSACVTRHGLNRPVMVEFYPPEGA